MPADINADTHPLRRALWVWHGDRIVQSESVTQELFRFVEAPKGDPKAKVTVLFLSCSIGTQYARSSIAKFLAEAHRSGVRVDYLCGESNYGEPGHVEAGLGQVKAVLAFNRDQTEASRFDGIQFDVEPYALPGWPKPSILSNYLAFLSACQSEILHSGQHLALGAAIPRWYDGADLHGLYRSVLDRVDYVAVMDYVREPRAFIDDARRTVEYASKTGKDVWLGAEVSELPHEKTATFYELGNAKLEQTFAAACQAFSGSKGFAGVAIEWYDTYVELRP
ncbi:MAG: hypothetical protein P4L46_08280 [Fimbriimonas sp.]|nr:hypothetical protein [Fimbriimonas sp.]